MGKNLVRINVTANMSWVAPAGVKQVKLVFQDPQKFFSIAAGNFYSLAVTTAGALYSWGANGTGELGSGTVTPRSSPVLVTGSYAKVSASVNPTSLAVGPSGIPYGWGDNGQGAIGDGTIVNKSTPTLVQNGALFFKEIFALNTDGGPSDEGSALALDFNGVAYTWGFGTSGQLGDNTIVSKSSPVAVVGGLTFTKIGGGEGHFSAIATNGNMYSWGLGSTIGGLGDGTQGVSKSSPVLVAGGLSWVEVGRTAGGVSPSTSSGAFAGITNTGAAYTWGVASNGALGNNTSTGNMSSPVAVVGGLSFTKIAVGEKFMVAISTSGAAYSWGENGSGQLGDGTIVAKSSPVAVSGGLSFTDIICGTTHVLGVANGVLYSWGLGTSGQLGDGTIVSKSSPVLVGNPLGMPAFVNEAIVDVTPGTTYSVKQIFDVGFNGSIYTRFPGCQYYIVYFA